MNNLVPAMAQDYQTGEILMQAYVNPEALQNTLDTWNATYWSRSRSELWEKWATSGTTQKVYEILTDCDNDSIIYKVKQLWEPPVACHTWERSCFYNSLAVLQKSSQANISNILNELFETLSERKVDFDSWEIDANTSYTAKLFSQWVDKILQKFSEETLEVVLWVKNNDRQNTVYELADVLYFMTVLMVQVGINPSMIANELEGRFWTSGIEEKSNRT